MPESGATRRYEIKKYPNRRFYDVTRSRHVTLADLYELVRVGNEITVTDSATGHDITNAVLAQIILEHDPPKLGLFPASLLHQAIQANEQMMRKFIDRYFSRAMDAFVHSRQQFDDYLRRIGFSPLTPLAPFDWVRMLFPNAAGPAGGTPSAAAGIRESSNDESPGGDAEVGRQGGRGDSDETLDSLRRQMASLRTELDSLRSRVKPGRGRPRKANQKKPRR